jgi:hypothetical protein
MISKQVYSEWLKDSYGFTKIMLLSYEDIYWDDFVTHWQRHIKF